MRVHLLNFSLFDHVLKVESPRRWCTNRRTDVFDSSPSSVAKTCVKTRGYLEGEL
jgi:hypothetical protein